MRISAIKISAALGVLASLFILSTACRKGKAPGVNLPEAPSHSQVPPAGDSPSPAGDAAGYPPVKPADPSPTVEIKFTTVEMQYDDDGDEDDREPRLTYKVSDAQVILKVKLEGRTLDVGIKGNEFTIDEDDFENEEDLEVEYK